MHKLFIPFQLLMLYSGIGMSYLVTKFFEYSSKFMYLYLMDDDQRTEFRNQVASRIRDLKSLESDDLLLGEDPLDEMSLAKIKVIKFYAWLCKNQ
jgi:hypothetical protein